MNKIKEIDSLEYLKTFPDYSLDINFSDPPYGLGSEVIIKSDGKPEYSKAFDFMNKWDMPTGEFWESWFKESFRTLKYGGYCIMFGMDRQLLIPKYYAGLAGFQEQQSLYWYFISSFPKSADLSKNIDKNAGKEREIVGIIERGDVQKAKKKGVEFLNDYANRNNIKQFGYGTENITKPSTSLAQKYEGMKYSISPLKQTQEVIEIFHKKLTFEQNYFINIFNNIIEVLKCITIKIKEKELGNGILVLDVELNFIAHQVEKYLKNGNHIVPMNVDLIEKLNVKSVEKNFTTHLVTLLNFVQENVITYPCEVLGEQTIHNGLVEDLNVQMDILLLEIQKTNSNIHLNIELLWLIILTENLNLVKMCITSTKTEVITELKILNYIHMENIKLFMELKQSKNEKLHSSIVNSVMKNFINEIVKLQELNEIFVQKNIGTNIYVEKQTNETILVFQKPYKTGSCLHDTLAYENGDEECCCGALDIDNNRVGINGGRNNGSKPDKNGYGSRPNKIYGKIKSIEKIDYGGRFPSQTFCDSECAKILDEQSGIKTSGAMKSTYNVGKSGKDGYLPYHDIYGKYKAQPYPKNVESSSGGCSKILHKCDFEDNEHDIYFYVPKVSSKERNSGINKNLHPTLKPISLNTQILKLFKTPNTQKIIFPFAGAGSEIIGGIKAGFNDWAGCELNPEYIEIANARIKYWTNKKIENGKIVSDNKIKNLLDFF